ncbi:MAG: HD-GYP domain-containing protein [Alicyclobacillus sp.]|nr:HD-GYP domain-containing protein [Alicyclobacillus sp.]
MLRNEPRLPSSGLAYAEVTAGHPAGPEHAGSIQQALRIASHTAPFDAAAYYEVALQDGVRVARRVQTWLAGQRWADAETEAAAAAARAETDCVPWVARETDAIGVLPRVLREESVLHVDDYPRHADAHPAWAALGLRRCALVPVHVRLPDGTRQFAGILAAGSLGEHGKPQSPATTVNPGNEDSAGEPGRPGEFRQPREPDGRFGSEGSIAVLEAAAWQLGHALEQSHALLRLRSSLTLQDKLHEGIRRIGSARNVPDAIDALLSHLSVQFGAEMAMLCVMDDKLQVLEVIGSLGCEDLQDVVGLAEDSYWLWSRNLTNPSQGVAIRDIAGSPYRTSFKAYLVNRGIRRATISPITFAGDPIGCLACFWRADTSYGFEHLPQERADGLLSSTLAAPGAAAGDASGPQPPSPPWMDHLAAVFSGVYTALVEAQRAVDAKVQSLSTLGIALESRDGETFGHTQRVVSLMSDFGARLGFDRRQMEWAIVGAYLHDIGKIAIPDSILLKPGPLTPNERVIIESHTVQGYNIARRLPFVESPSLDIILSHHERWDGRGYPNKLAGPAIPQMARMFALIDVYDALTHRRPYKQAWSANEAADYLASMAGTQFDPELTQVFLQLVLRREAGRR